jgi:hypothetical protein
MRAGITASVLGPELFIKIKSTSGLTQYHSIPYDGMELLKKKLIQGTVLR